MTERADYTAGLRALADLIDRNPGLRLPYAGTTSAMLMFADNVADAAAWGAELDGVTVEYRHDEEGVSYPHRQHGGLRGLQIAVFGPAVAADEAVSV